MIVEKSDLAAPGAGQTGFSAPGAGPGPVHVKVNTHIEKNIKLPGELKFKDLAENELSEPARAFFSMLDSKMLALNFSPVKTFTLQGYANASESRMYCSAEQGINLMASFAAPAGRQAMTVFQFSTRFTDGSVVLTSNLGNEGQLLPPPDYETVARFPGVNDPAELLKHHSKAIDKKKAANLVTVYIGPEEVMDEMQKGTKRRMEHFVAKGLLTFDPTDNTYSPTAKLLMTAPIKPHVSVKFKVNKKE
jgi:hypothetical protein